MQRVFDTIIGNIVFNILQSAPLNTTKIEEKLVALQLPR